MYYLERHPFAVLCFNHQLLNNVHFSSETLLTSAVSPQQLTRRRTTDAAVKRIADNLKNFTLVTLSYKDKLHTKFSINIY